MTSPVSPEVGTSSPSLAGLAASSWVSVQHQAACSITSAGSEDSPTPILLLAEQAEHGELNLREMNELRSNSSEARGEDHAQAEEAALDPCRPSKTTLVPAAMARPESSWSRPSGRYQGASWGRMSTSGEKIKSTLTSAMWCAERLPSVSGPTGGKGRRGVFCLTLSDVVPK